MAIFTSVQCDYCQNEFAQAGIVPRAKITDEALQASWAVWPDGSAMCPECCKTHDTTDCGDAWKLEAYLAVA